MPKPRTEAQNQIAAVAWARCADTLEELPALAALHHVPNGEQRDRVTGMRLKLMGVLAGVPDLCLPVSRGPAHGLYIEMKQPGGRASAAQQRVHYLLEREHYEIHQVVGHDAVKRILRGYLAQPQWRLAPP